jgi:hypothetical protein
MEESLINLSDEIDNEMVKIRVWIDPYWKRDEHNHRVLVRGHWKIIDVNSDDPRIRRYTPTSRTISRR